MWVCPYFDVKDDLVAVGGTLTVVYRAAAVDRGLKVHDLVGGQVVVGHVVGVAHGNVRFLKISFVLL